MAVYTKAGRGSTNTAPSGQSASIYVESGFSGVTSAPSGRETLPIGPGRVLIATTAGPLIAQPDWTAFDTLTNCRCAGFDWQRGRQSEFDITGTGTARVFFHDRGTTFDSEDLIGRQIMLQLYDPVAEVWQPVFRGHIDDMPSEPSPGAPELTNVQLDCVDIFDYLSGAKFVVGQMGDPPPVDMGGIVFYEDGPADDRITALLDDAGIKPSMYVTFSLNVDVNETVYDPDDVILRGLREVVDAEFPGIAQVYVDRFGRIATHGRFARFSPDSVSADAGDVAWDFRRWEAATRSDVGTTRAQIREFKFNRPRTRIINSCLAWPAEDENGYQFPQKDVDALVSTDPPSIAAYGHRGKEMPNLIIKEHKTNGNTGAQECALFAEFYTANYAVPRKNVDRVTFQSISLDHPAATPTWALICGMDISDIIHLWIDEAGLTDAEFYIEGVSGSCRPMSPGIDYVTVTPNLSPAAYYTDNVFAGT